MPIAYLIAFIVNATFALFLAVRAPRSQERTVTLATIGSLAVWQIGEFGVMVAADAFAATLWMKLTYAGLITLPLNFVFFSMSFPVRQERFWRCRAVPWIATVPPSVLIAMLFGSVLIRGAERVPHGFAHVSGPLFNVIYIYMPVYLLIGLAQLIFAMKYANSRIQKAQCGYVIAGAVSPITLGLLHFNVLAPLGIQGLHYLLIPLTAIMPTTANVYALTRYRLFDVPGAVRSGVVHFALVALLLLPCLAVYALAESSLPSSSVAERELVVAALLVLAGFVFPRIKIAAHETLDQALFRGRPDYRRILTGTIREIATILERESLNEMVSSRVREALQVEHVVLLVRAQDGSAYRPITEGNADLVITGHDVRQLDQWIDRAPSEPWSADDPMHDAELDRIVNRLGAAICFPLHVKAHAFGLLVLGPRANGRAYLDDEVELLSALANQVAVAAENARLYEALKESKQMLQRASRLSAVGTLAAGLAHEIRNPLVAVQTFLQILPERLDDPEVMGELREVALGELQRVCRLINDLLGMARSPVATFESTDLGDVVAQVGRLLAVSAEKKGVRLTRTGGTLPASYVDPGRVKQAVLNLVMNAIQASPGGGEVTIATRSGVDPAGRAYVEVAVHDTGPGIPAAHLEAIFHPFFTTKDSGTGLGLAVTQQIVADHGGAIHVESEEGRGATFVVRLPVEERPPAALRQMPPIYGLGKGRVTDDAAPSATAPDGVPTHNAA